MVNRFYLECQHSLSVGNSCLEHCVQKDPEALSKMRLFSDVCHDYRTSGTYLSYISQLCSKTTKGVRYDRYSCWLVH